MKNTVYKKIDKLSTELEKIADYIFDNPEIGLKEYKAMKILTEFLEKHNFIVEKGIAGIETAFKATYKNGRTGPSIGILVEYDALENLGHACAHHLQGPIGIGTAVAIAENIKDLDYKVVVYGTPAEETIGGKLIMLKNGCFKDIDIALMTHGGPNTTTDIKSMAMCKLNVIFKGKSSHAALQPESGRSALDALLLTFNAVEFLREHVPEDVKMHYTIQNAGGPANIVPEEANGIFYLRSYNNKTLEECKRRFFKIVEGASLMTETISKVEILKEMGGKIPVLSLNNLIMKNAIDIKAPAISNPREKTGSTDFGSVMSIVPGTCLRVAFVPEGTASHSQEYLKSGKTKAAHEAIIIGAKALAGTIYDIISEPKIFKEIKDEFSKKVK